MGPGQNAGTLKTLYNIFSLLDILHMRKLMSFLDLGPSPKIPHYVYINIPQTWKDYELKDTSLNL